MFLHSFTNTNIPQYSFAMPFINWPCMPVFHRVQINCTDWQVCLCYSFPVLSCSFDFISWKRKSSGSRQQCPDLGDEILWADRKGPLLKRSLTQQRTEHCWQRANENKLIQWRLRLYVPPSLLLSLCVYVCARECVCNSWHSPKLLLKTWWHRTGNWDIWILRGPFDLASHCLCPPSLPPSHPPPPPFTPPRPRTAPTCSSRLQPLEGIVQITGPSQSGSSVSTTMKPD